MSRPKLHSVSSKPSARQIQQRLESDKGRTLVNHVILDNLPVIQAYVGLVMLGAPVHLQKIMGKILTPGDQPTLSLAIQEHPQGPAVTPEAPALPPESPTPPACPSEETEAFKSIQEKI
jgi:hypothetical protein